MKTEIEETTEVKSEGLSIEYVQPKFWHRVMANFVDIFLMIITFLILFFSVRSIVQVSPYYKNVSKRMDEIRLESGLYMKKPEEEDTLVDIVYFCNTYIGIYGNEFNGESSDGGEPVGKNGKLVKSIDTFISYCHENCQLARYDELVSYYDEFRLNATLNGVHYFIEDGGEKIVPNPTLAESPSNYSEYYNNVYVPFIEKRCIPFLTSNVPEFHELTRVDYRFLVFLEFPVAYVFAGIFTYLIPPLFFRRGRMTLGKALYHVGLIDNRLLSPTIGKFLARFAIFFFGELILSLFSFGIPYIVSFSLMAFSKSRKGFPDYMLKLTEVDTSQANIYMDYVEAELQNNLHGAPVDFKMKKPL